MSTQNAVNQNVESQNEVIFNSKKILSDEKLMQEMNKINIDALAEKTERSNSIWTKEAKSKFENDKKARTSLRKTQLSLCQKVVKFSQIKDAENLNLAFLNLYNFSKVSLIDMKNYTGVSDKLSPEKKDVLQKSYSAMLKAINAK